MYQDEINAYFDSPARAQALVEAVCRLCAIRSVKEAPQPGMPFGPGPARALDEALILSGELGFTTRNYEGYVGTADLCDQETTLHILGHLDVVGEGTGWTVTEPYAPKAVDGMLYGRGVADDKGPMVAALFAMRAVQALGVPLKRNVRLILGTDEESGSADIAYYFAREPHAPFTFSPDGEFPVINIEKGSYKPVFTKTWAESTALPRLRALHGGFRINVLPPEADAVVEGLAIDAFAPYCAQIAEKTGAQFSLTETDGGINIHCAGAGAHASTPQGGNNAITALLTLLCALPLAESDSKRALQDLNTLFPHGDTQGAALGIAQSDGESGALSLAFSLLEVSTTDLSGQFDARLPLCSNTENCRSIAVKAFEKYGMSATGDMAEPHYVPADSPFVQTLLKCYQQYTGNQGACISIGGGTYVHEIPGGVAFGCGMPGFNPNMHGANEHIDIKDLMTACKIFTQVMIDLCA